jgi:hypothetical protein
MAENIKNDISEVSMMVNTQKTGVIDPIAWKQIKGMADTLIESKAIPQYIQNKEQAIVVMQTGYEMGMKPMEALNSLYLVNGQITIWGKALVKRFKVHGWTLSYKDKKDETTVTATHKKTGEVVSEIMTFEEAEKSGYTRGRDGKLKFGWQEGTNRILKLRYGALNKMLKTQLPEVLESAQGVAEVYQDSKSPEEYQKVQEGEVLEGEKLDDELVKRINKAKTHQELINTCKAIKTEVNADYHNALELEYARRKEEISETVEEK